MSSSPSLCKDTLLAMVRQAGAVAAGVTSTTPIDPDEADAYRRWIGQGRHGEMAYLERYDDIRHNPSLILEGSQSIIVAAFPYSSVNPQAPGSPRIARYALGLDYHTVLRRRLAPVVAAIEDVGAAARVCVDSAPVRERLLAARAGVGFIGRNGLLIVPGAGSYHFLAEIFTTLELTPDAPCRLGCGECGRCVDACPAGALRDRCVDASRCLSYLTIEYRGEKFPAGVDLGGRLFGCDACQEVCPHNRANLPDPLTEFEPLPQTLGLDPESLTPSAFRRLFRDTPLSRSRLPLLLRNLHHRGDHK